MDGEFKSVGVDDVVASAAHGVLRAFEARRFGEEQLSVDKLVRSGFSIKFEIWAGGPWIRQFTELNPQPLPPAGDGRTFGQATN